MHTNSPAVACFFLVLLSCSLTTHTTDKPISYKKSNEEIAFGYKNGYVNLTCIAEAEPKADFKWFKGEKELNKKNHKIFNDEHVSFLQLHVKDDSVFTVYKCEAHNKHGHIKHSFTLKEGTKPEPPSRVSVEYLALSSKKF